MSKYVLNASAFLASLQNEDGYKIVEAITADKSWINIPNIKVQVIK